MAINVVYGPMGQALGLAQVAGAGQGYNLQAQRDLQALQLQNQMQNTINSNNANLIQLSMARDQAAASNAAHQQQLQQQAVAQQAQQEQMAQNAKRIDQQQQLQTAEQNTREAQAQAIAAAKAQELKDKQAKDAWIQTLTPEQRNAVLSGAGLPMARPAGEQSLESQASDRRIREAAAVETLLNQVKMDAQDEENLRKTLVPDEAAINAAHKKTQESRKAYQEASQQFSAGPANVAGFSAAPTKDQPASQSAPVSSAQGSAPTGPSPYGVGGRKQMPDGTIWTWNGVTWTKG